MPRIRRIYVFLREATLGLQTQHQAIVRSGT